MPIPNHGRLDDALLWYIYHHGGKFCALKPAQVYDGLADLLKLTVKERSERTSRWSSQPRWKLSVQVAREHLLVRGDVTDWPKGRWTLTPQGVARAEALAPQFCAQPKCVPERSWDRATPQRMLTPPVPSIPQWMRPPEPPKPPTAPPPVSRPELEETDYSLATIMTRQKVSHEVQVLFHELLHGIDKAVRSWGDQVLFRTHAKGACGFCQNQKAFLYLTLREDCVTALYYTGASKIAGLQKGDWLAPDDRAGSETHRIDDDKSLKKAINFASSAYAIAALGAATVAAAPPSTEAVHETHSDDTESVLDIFATIPQTHSVAPKFARRPVSSAAPQEYVFDPDDLTI